MIYESIQISSAVRSLKTTNYLTGRLCLPCPARTNSGRAVCKKQRARGCFRYKVTTSIVHVPKLNYTSEILWKSDVCFEEDFGIASCIIVLLIAVSIYKI